MRAGTGALPLPAPQATFIPYAYGVLLIRHAEGRGWGYTRGMIFHVTLEEADEAGWIVAECPALPGCFSQGRDEKEALANIREAITAWLWAEDQKALAALPKREGVPPLVVAV